MTPAALRSLARTARWGGVRVRPTGPRGRARSAVLTGLALAAAAHVGLAAAVETRRPEWRDPEFGHRLRQVRALDRWRREAAPDRPLVVVVGSSRAALGFSPAHLGLDAGSVAPVVYNFSHSGYGPGGQYVSLRRLLDHGVVPARVLLEVHPPALAVDEVPDPIPPDGSLSLVETHHLAAYRDRPVRALGRWVDARARSWYTLRHSLVSHAGFAEWLPPPLRKDYLWEALHPSGWMPYAPAAYPPGRRAAATDKAAVDHAPLLAAFRVAPAQDRVLRGILATATAAGAKPALLLMPESPTFRGWYPPGARQLVRDTLADLSREFGAPVFDASEWVNDEEAFTDGHHLLGPAAERFSARLGRECVGPWLRAGGAP